VVRAYAWRMTVERFLRILISAIRKPGFFKGLRLAASDARPAASAARCEPCAVGTAHYARGRVKPLPDRASGCRALAATTHPLGTTAALG
jgi:hypothetical protein